MFAFYVKIANISDLDCTNVLEGKPKAIVCESIGHVTGIQGGCINTNFCILIPILSFQYQPIPNTDPILPIPSTYPVSSSILTNESLISQS